MPGEDTIVVVCKCGKKLKAPAGSAGKKARCPACGNVLLLTTAAPRPVVAIAAPVRKAPVTVPADDDAFGALYDLAAQAESAPPPIDAVRCPQCTSEMEDDAVLCTNCGYNTRTGKALATATAVAKPAKAGKLAAFGANSKAGKQPIDLMAPQGSFMAGLALSAAFALAASVVWFLIAWTTGFTVGYIAILIGGAAGAGMKIGQKGFSSTGGTAAAALTLAAIMCAKFAVIEVILMRAGSHKSIFDLSGPALGYYFFSPIGLIIIVIGMGAAFRTANGSISD